MNPIYILLGAFALWYLPTGFALLRMEFELKDFGIISIQADYIDIGINLLIKNTTPIPFTISRVDAQVFINGTYVSKAYIGHVPVESFGTGHATAIVRLNKQAVGATIWNIIIQNNFLNTVITFQGTAHSGGRTYPFSTDLRISEF